jgi:argininosuccinate synthase
VNRRRIVLAFSGDARSCAAVKWLRESCHADVVALLVDVGQLDDLQELRTRAIGCGVTRAHLLDRCEAFAREAILPVASALAPPDAASLHRLAHRVIAAALVEIAAIEGADAVAYASTHPSLGEHLQALDPALNVVVVAGEGMSATGPVRDGCHLLMRRPTFAANEPAHVTIEFDAGAPVSVNGVTMELRELIESLSLIGGEYAAATSAAPALDLLRDAYSVCSGHGSFTLRLQPAQPVLVNP